MDTKQIADGIAASSTIWATAQNGDITGTVNGVMAIINKVMPAAASDLGVDVADILSDTLTNYDSTMWCAVEAGVQAYADDCQQDSYGRGDGLWKWDHEVNLHH